MKISKIIKGIIGLGIVGGTAYFACKIGEANGELNERYRNENNADSLMSAYDGAEVTIVSVKREVKTENPPKLYNLTSLQREANKFFGYTAQQTLDYVQSLYETKLVTYPRTDSQFLTEDMKLTALDVIKFCDTCFDFAISHIPDVKKVINNDKVSGHHAIIPTANIATAELSPLPAGERNILTLIATRLVCATAPAHKYYTKSKKTKISR